MLQLRLHLVAQQHALRRQAVEDSSAGLVGLGLERDASARRGIHGLGESVREAATQSHEVGTEGVLVAVDARPDDREIGVHFETELKSPGRTVDGGASRRLDRARQRAPLELGIVEEQRNHGDERDARVGRELLPDVDVVLVDLVRIVRFETRQAVVLEACGDLQPRFQVDVGLVLVVEAAIEGREKPDAGGELEVEFEALQMPDEVVARSHLSLGP